VKPSTIDSGAKVDEEVVATQQTGDSALTAAWKERARVDGLALFRAAVRAHMEVAAGRADAPDRAAAEALLRMTFGDDTQAVATMIGLLMEPINHDDWTAALAGSSSADFMFAYGKALLEAYAAAAAAFRAAPTIDDFLGEPIPEEGRWRAGLHAFGVQALSASAPATVQQRAADLPRLVIFHYCVSLGIVSFKRSSGIKVIPPGGSRFLAALPYTLISLCAGWWGIPWGPIWTLEAIGRNLGGGTDVTELVAATAA
jgi:hypothetical protein